MTNQILIKKSAVPNRVPATTDIVLGELALNTYDGKLYFKKNVTGIETVLEICPDNLYSKLTGVPWLDITNNPVTKSVQIPAMSGTSLIPLDNTTPLITEGTLIASATYTPVSVNSRLLINGSFLVDCNTSNRNFILSIFKDDVCIGANVMNFVSAGRPNTFSFSFDDISMGNNGIVTPINYTIRFGVSSAATWYINRMATAILNGLMASNSIIFMEYAQ